jgi:nitrile hydratase beta subunit
MDGIHDMGGMQGFGRVSALTDEPAFGEPWEGRAFSLGLLAIRASGTNLHAFRHAIERVPPADYLAGYYSRWLEGAERLLTDSGILAAGAVDARARKLSGADVAEPGAPEPHKPQMASGGPGNLRQVEAGSLFKPGDRVRVRDIHPSGHTRLPGYVRGHTGTVAIVQPAAVLPDTAAHFRGENPQHVYAVEFDSADLWGPDSEPFRVSVDLFESYLEEAP